MKRATGSKSKGSLRLRIQRDPPYLSDPKVEILFKYVKVLKCNSYTSDKARSGDCYIHAS